MAPTLVASRTALPPGGALRLRPGKAGSAAPAGVEEHAPTLATACAALPPGGALRLRPGKAGSAAPARGCGDQPVLGVVVPTLVASLPARVRGFTLIELLVALAAMALMAGLSWRGLDGMVRAQAQLQQRADAVLTLQAGLTQWAADLDSLLQLPQTTTLDWDGRSLRIVRRSADAPGSGLLVVAWARRSMEGTGQWLRWQSAPVSTQTELQAAWAKAGQWAQNPGDDEKRREVRITPLEEWQVFYFRGNAWTNPLSSDSATQVQGSEKPAPVNVALPDGVRLVLTLAPSEAINGVLTRDWVRPIVGGNKS
ncbi:MAG: prepilin-type N-terminal cleavage/methylation domain-containing protein [Polaromonas sp.]